MEDRRAQVLYLSIDGLLDALGQSQILPYLCGLADKGYEISIVSFEKHPWSQSEKAEIDRICSAHRIRWVPLRYHRTPPILSTLYNLYRLERTANRLWKEKQFKIVHCRSYLTSLVGIRMKKKYGVKFIFDMRGFWPDERVEGGLWNLGNPIFRKVYGYFKAKEVEFISNADHIVCLTNNAKKEILSWQLTATAITVIPTCVDLDLFDPKKIKEADMLNLRTGLGIQPGDFVLLYLGSWGTWYLTDEMLDFFSALKKIKPSAKFLLITPDKIDLRNYEHRHDVIVRKAPRNSVPLYISLASVSIFFIKPSYSKMASSATKMGEIMAMNVPLVTNPGWGDVEEIVKNSGGLLHEIDKTEVTTAELEKINSQTREYCLENLSLEVGIECYSKVYAEVQ